VSQILSMTARTAFGIGMDYLHRPADPTIWDRPVSGDGDVAVGVDAKSEDGNG
jgi:hypothetical protein